MDIKKHRINNKNIISRNIKLTGAWNPIRFDNMPAIPGKILNTIKITDIPIQKTVSITWTWDFLNFRAIYKHVIKEANKSIPLKANDIL